MAKMPEYDEEHVRRVRRAIAGDPDAHTSHLIIGGRRSGKTTKLLKWLEDAQRRPYYPFWDRVLLAHTTDRAQHLRIALRREAELKGIIDSGLYYNLVYSYDEWKSIRLGGDVMIGVDDVEFLINRYFGQTPSMIVMHVVSYDVSPGGA